MAVVSWNGTAPVLQTPYKSPPRPRKPSPSPLPKDNLPLSGYRSRSHFIAAIKQTCGCVDCGKRDGQLDFDHRDSSTKIHAVGKLVTARLARLLAEIEKCDVRCVACHTRRHKVAI